MGWNMYILYLFLIITKYMMLVLLEWILSIDQSFSAQKKLLSKNLNLNDLKYRADKKKGCRDFFYHILSTYEIQYPKLCELIVILLAFSPSTGPLERSYSKLGKICYKDRNRMSDINIETLYLLAVLQINDTDFFPKIRELLENN